MKYKVLKKTTGYCTEETVEVEADRAEFRGNDSVLTFVKEDTWVVALEPLLGAEAQTVDRIVLALAPGQWESFGEVPDEAGPEEDLKKTNPEVESSPVTHLVVLHRVLYGTIDPQKALDYLHQHLREDADLADMGRPLKYQYQGSL